MKSLLLTLATVLLAVCYTQAQINKGSILLGGDLGFSTQTTKHETTPAYERKLTSISLMPSVAIAVKEDLFAGIQLQYANQKDENNPQNYDYHNRNTGLGFFVRKYKALGSGGFYLFGQTGVGYTFTNTDVTNVNAAAEENHKRHSVNAYIQPGISYAISKKFQLETGLNNLFSIGYFTERTRSTTAQNPGGVNTFKTNGSNASSSLGNTGTPFYFGFRILLQK